MAKKSQSQYGIQLSIYVNDDKGESAMFIECLRYAGLVSEVTPGTGDPERPTYRFYAPQHDRPSIDAQIHWQASNCQRIRSFGLKAIPITRDNNGVISQVK